LTKLFQANNKHMNTITYLSFLVSPVIVVLSVVYLDFKFSIKSWKFLRQAVFLGAVSVVVVVAANYLIKIVGLENLKNMRRTAFYVFVVVAFGSEFGKLLVLQIKFFKLKSFNGPLAGIIYSVFVSLGFAFVAVLLYAFGILGTEKMKLLSWFLWIYPFANIVFGIVLGFFIGMGKIRDNRLIDITTGLGISTFFHALFYFCFLTSDHRLLIFTGIGFVIIAITLIIKAASIEEVKT